METISQCSSFLNWEFCYQEEEGLLMEELRHSLLCTTLELEKTIVSANEEIDRREIELIQLRDVLSKTIKERDDFQTKCQNLVLEKHFLEKQLQKQQQQEKSAFPLCGGSNSTCTSREDESKPTDSGSTKRFSSASPAAASSPPKVLLSKALSPGSLSPKPLSPKAPFEDAVLDNLVSKRPLPEQGKLLKAVTEAGPLLQTLILAGPLPQWQHPPPKLDAIEIPPVAISSSPSPTPSRLLIHQESFNIRGGCTRKRSFDQLNEGSDNNSSPRSKNQIKGH